MNPFEERRYARLHGNGWLSEVIQTDADSCDVYVTTADGSRRPIVSMSDLEAAQSAADGHLATMSGHACTDQCEDWRPF